MESSVRVNIKMYRVVGLGDCFLLNFSNANNTINSTVLIDCGSSCYNESSKMRMRGIAKDIKKQLNGRPLSVVVGTNQHNDHLSGFDLAESIFNKIRVNQIWLSWLDNFRDLEAQRIQKAQLKLINLLNEINKGLENVNDGKFKGVKAKQRLTDILGFYSIALNSDAQSISTRGLSILKSLSNKINFLESGQTLTLPGFDESSIKVYVLGPPRNKALFLNKEIEKNEFHDQRLSMATTLAENFLSALTNFYTNDGLISNIVDSLDEKHFPFSNFLEKTIESDPFLSRSYLAEKKGWQQADNEWLSQAERLAVYLNSYTNNNSLVLAFELVHSAKVLLFVGDAQLGNWSSWKGISWKENEKNKINELLANTVLYKVGNHCSHNATLIEALEKMEHDELVAMIPIDRTDLRIKRKDGWKMPATNLYNRLKEKTQNRVLVMDRGWDPECDPFSNASDSWSKLHKPKNDNPLYVEYEVEA